MWSKKEICSFVDLTSLNTSDSVSSIESFLNDALDHESKGFKVAAVCVFPNFGTQAIKKLHNSKIKVAVVAGSFPNSQSFLSVRLNECEMALECGVDELDIVLNVGALRDEDYSQVTEEIRAVKHLAGSKKLKVILETGLLKSEALIKKASELAIEGGADFIKTSTGKDFPGASPEAVKVMCQTILENHNRTGSYVGLKISGGVKTYEDAVTYFKLVEGILGEKFMNPDLLRIGASSLLKNLANG